MYTPDREINPPSFYKKAKGYIVKKDTTVTYYTCPECMQNFNSLLFRGAIECLNGCKGQLNGPFKN